MKMVKSLLLGVSSPIEPIIEGSGLVISEGWGLEGNGGIGRYIPIMVTKETGG